MVIEIALGIVLAVVILIIGAAVLAAIFNQPEPRKPTAPERTDQDVVLDRVREGMAKYRREQAQKRRAQ